MTRTPSKRNRRKRARARIPPNPPMTDGTVGIHGSTRLTLERESELPFQGWEGDLDPHTLPGFQGSRTDPTPLVGRGDAGVSPSQPLDPGCPGPAPGCLGLDLEPSRTGISHPGSDTPGPSRGVPRVGARDLGSPGSLVGRTPWREDGNLDLAVPSGRRADPSSCRDSWTTARLTEGGTSPGGGTSAGVPVIGRVVPFSRVVVDDRGRALPPTDLR